MIYDLIVVGNGLAAQAFLFELFSHLKSDVKKYQNFSVAQIFSEEIAPACSLRSTATVSLTGITTGISDLGDDLNKSFYLFEDFVKKHNPLGVEKVKQIVTFTNETHQKKMIRRYKTLYPISSSLLKTPHREGVELDSYLVDPQAYAQWFNAQISGEKIHQQNNFLKGLAIDEEGLVHCELMDKELLKTKKLVLCTGAYAKIYSHFFDESFELESSQVVPGAYLERSIDLNRPSFYFTIDGHNLIYRSTDQTLILGSVSSYGAFLTPDYAELKKIHRLFAETLNLSLGSFSEFKTVVGLRHKGKKRAQIARALNSSKSVYMINGFYKNGYTLNNLCAQKIVAEIFTH